MLANSGSEEEDISCGDGGQSTFAEGAGDDSAHQNGAGKEEGKDGEA